jgi:hypothetical protein
MASFYPIISSAKTAQSLSIDYNNGTITTATLTATITEGDDTSFSMYLSANGSNWEQVANGVAHTFTNTGTGLRWKIIGSGKISKLVINNYH